MRTAFFGAGVGAALHSYWNSVVPSSSTVSSSSSSSSYTTTTTTTATSASSTTATATAECAFQDKSDIVHLKALPPAVDAKEFREFPLINVYDESPDSKVFRFAFPDGGQKADLRLTSFVVLKYQDEEGKDIIRPYTPISRLDQRGYIEFLIKCYKGAKMGNHLFKMKLGDTIEMKGPFEKLAYKPGMYKKIGMIAGGTGITPMFQLAREALKEPKATSPEISLIYANKRKEDVLLGSELSQLYEVHQHFAPYFVLEEPPKDWMGGVGYVSKDMVKMLMPPPSRAVDSVICVCGPPGFMKHVSGQKDFTTSPPSQGELGGVLKDLGYPARMVYKF